MTGYTHTELVAMGERWLRGSVGCPVVVTELVSMAAQIPDVIGFTSDTSYLIEVKVSRSDFLADRKKWHQSRGLSAGNYRWYLAPPGLLCTEDLPHGWGLLEPQGTRMKIVRGSLRRGRPSWDDENKTLVAPKAPKAGIAHRFENVALGTERMILFSIARRALEQAVEAGISKG